jgi:Zn-dependent protease
MDPLGSLMMLSGMFIGWAKPVPVDARNIRNPRSGLPLVSFAGPLSNILLGIAFCLVFALASSRLSPGSGSYLLIVFFIKTNFALAIFNLLPVYPLDGSKIITVFMPDRMADQYEERIMRLGMFPLVILIAFEFLPFGKGILGLWFQLWSPLVRPILMLFGIPPWLLGY